jgi:hypothetical protein
MQKPTSRNLWNVRMQHMAYESLWVLASTAEKAAGKAIRFCRRNDGLSKPVVKEVKYSGTIDAF